MVWIASVIITLGLLYARAPDIWPARFWAEDLYEFLMRAQHDGIHSLFYSYAGYLHIAPRLVSLVATGLPEKYAPEVFLFFVLFFTGWAAAIIARSIGGFAGILAGTSLILANGWMEPVGSVTNLQWLLAPTLLLLAVRPNGVTRAEGIIFAAIASTSGPFATAFAPVYLFVLVRSFTKEQKVNLVALVAIIGGAVQLAEVLMNPAKPMDPSGDHVAWLFGRLFELSAGGGLAALAVVTLIGASISFGKYRVQRALLIAATLLLTVMVIAKFKTRTDLFITDLGAQRYWYVQSVILLLVGFLAIRDPSKISKAAGALAVAIIAGSSIYSGVSRAWFGTGSGWQDAVEKSYSAPVVYTYAPNWTMRLESGTLYRDRFP